MKWKYTFPYILTILVLQCPVGCVTTDKDAALDACLENLELRISHTLVDPVNSVDPELVVACELDYNLRYGTLKELNRNDVVQRLAKRKSEVVNCELVAREFTALSKETSARDPDYGFSYSELYSRAAAKGPEEARYVLSLIWSLIRLEIVNAPPLKK